MHVEHWHGLLQPGWNKSHVWRGGYGERGQEWFQDRNLSRLGNMGEQFETISPGAVWCCQRCGTGTLAAWESWDMDSNGDINVVFLDIDLWDNVGDLRGDSGVGFK